MVQPTGNIAAPYDKKPLITGDYFREKREVGDYGRASLYVPL